MGVEAGWSIRVRVTVLLAFFLAINLSIYYYWIYYNIRRARTRLQKTHDQIQLLITRTATGRLASYREKLFKLTAKIAVTSFFDLNRMREAARIRDQAGEALEKLDNSSNLSYTGLSEIETLLTALDEIINREEREYREQRNWQYAAIIVISTYIVGLVIAVIATGAATSKIPSSIFGVPNSVIFWGAAGSLGAILFRFYTEQGQIRFAAEFRWLIARPIIGIIMGAVVYLALKSGFILLGNPASPPPANLISSPTAMPLESVAVPPANMEIFWVIAFLSGFSDKFYLGIIDLLVARTVRSQEVNPDKTITEKERIPGPKPPEEHHFSDKLARGEEKKQAKKEDEESRDGSTKGQEIITSI